MPESPRSEALRRYSTSTMAATAKLRAAAAGAPCAGPPRAAPHACVYCRAKGRLVPCSRCGDVHYCSLQ